MALQEEVTDFLTYCACAKAWPVVWWGWEQRREMCSVKHYFKVAYHGFKCKGDSINITHLIDYLNLLKKISFSVLAIHSPNTPEYAIIYLGAASAGVTVTTINPIYTVCKFSFFLVFCQSLVTHLNLTAMHVLNSMLEENKIKPGSYRNVLQIEINYTKEGKRNECHHQMLWWFASLSLEKGLLCCHFGE